MPNSRSSVSSLPTVKVPENDPLLTPSATIPSIQDQDIHTSQQQPQQSEYNHNSECVLQIMPSPRSSSQAKKKTKRRKWRLLTREQLDSTTTTSPSSCSLTLKHHSEATLQTILQDMTLNEKLLLLTGSSLWTLHAIPRLHIPSLTVADGGHGVRKPLEERSLQTSHPATCFPPMCALACSWDRALLKTVGAAIRQECLHYNISVLLGPGLNLKRHACGGRNFEYFSEDPLLSGTLAASFIQGVQETNQVAACPKHFCVNNQETHRFVVNALVDPRTCRELYYKGFEIVVKESQPATIMCAYNKVNGIYASEHPFLLTQLLREEWGFGGICMTDWGATHDRAAGIAAGMDLEMPGSHGAHDRSIRQALEQGSLSVQDIDACTMRMLRLVNTYKATKVGRVDIDWDEHDRLARQAARESIVLLRNDNNLLPLARNTPIALIGDFAKDHPRIQGMGSAQVTPYRVETVYDAIQQYTDRVVFAQGYSGEDDHPTELNAELLSEAVDVARQGDVVLLFLGLPEIMESEGMDRAHMSLPAQHYALWNEIVAVNDNVVVILTNGGTVQLPDTYIKTRAILEGYLLGQAGGGAMCDILFGQQSPCGKLAETMPVSQTDILGDRYFPGDRDVVAYMEGLDVGYRQFNTTNSRVRYPFGHGLSYTSFSFANLRVHVDIDNEDEKAVRVEFDIRNTGSMAGKEVVQLYMRDVLASVYRPFHELRAYDKVSVEPGETKTLTMVLNSDAFSFWDIGRSDWTVEPGDFEIQIGSSSLDIALRETISLTTGNFASDQAIEAYPLKDNALEEVSPDVFVKRFGSLADVVSTAMVDSENNPSELFDRNSLLKETAKVSIIGRLFLHIVFTEASREIKPGQSEQRQKKMIRTNVENIPLRVLVLFSKGGLSFALLDGIIAILNGSYLFALVCFAYASMYAVRDTVSELCRCRKP